MALYRDEAVVLRTWKLAEADRIVSLHTKHNGKVRAVAKGVRRTRSKFGARLEPASCIAVQLYRGRGHLDSLTQAVTIERFASLPADPARFARASAILEAVDQVASESDPDPGRHAMLVGALRTLDRADSPLVVAGFFLKLLAAEGVQPQLDCCVSCGAGDPLVALDLVAGGVLCDGCRRGRPISPAALSTLRDMVGGRLGAVLRRASESHDDDPGGESAEMAEVAAVATAAMEAHIERRLRSLWVLDRS